MGMILIAGSCSVVGFSINSQLKTRVAALKSFLGATQLLQAEIVFRRSPLPDILPLIIRECPGAAASFYRTVLHMMTEKGCSFSLACDRASSELRHFSLKRDEIEWICSVSHIAGRYDAATQADRLSGILSRLELALRQAQDEAGQKGKLYRAVGVTAGIMIALAAV